MHTFLTFLLFRYDYVDSEVLAARELEEAGLKFFLEKQKTQNQDNLNLFPSNVAKFEISTQTI